MHPSGLQLHLKLKTQEKQVSSFLPVRHSILQFFQEIPVELVQLRQVIQDLIQDPVLNHWFPKLSGSMGNSIPEILLQFRGEKQYMYTYNLKKLFPLVTVFPKTTKIAKLCSPCRIRSWKVSTSFYPTYLESFVVLFS